MSWDIARTATLAVALGNVASRQVPSRSFLGTAQEAGRILKAFRMRMPDSTQTAHVHVLHVRCRVRTRATCHGRARATCQMRMRIHMQSTCIVTVDGVRHEHCAQLGL